MISKQDPEYHEVWRARYDEACRQFKAREMTEAVFAATLICLGFKNYDIQGEINLHYPPSPGRPA